MKKSTLFLFTIFISILLISAAQAGWVSLTGDLFPVSSLPADELQIGDKVFTDFEVIGISTGGAHKPSADSVLVQGGMDDGTGNYGLRFNLDWVAGTCQTITASINYKVSILSGYDPWLIEDAILFLANSGATGAGIVNGCQTIFDADFLGNTLAVLDVSREEGVGSNLIDHEMFELDGNPAQVKEIWVRTSFTISGGIEGTPGTAQLSEVYMLYSQIPEPATVLLLGLGALALVRLRRR